MTRDGRFADGVERPVDREEVLRAAELLGVELAEQRAGGGVEFVEAPRVGRERVRAGVDDDGRVGLERPGLSARERGAGRPTDPLGAAAGGVDRADDADLVCAERQAAPLDGVIGGRNGGVVGSSARAGERGAPQHRAGGEVEADQLHILEPALGRLARGGEHDDAPADQRPAPDRGALERRVERSDVARPGDDAGLGVEGVHARVAQAPVRGGRSRDGDGPRLGDGDGAGVVERDALHAATRSALLGQDEAGRFEAALGPARREGVAVVRGDHVARVQEDRVARDGGNHLQAQRAGQGRIGGGVDGLRALRGERAGLEGDRPQRAREHRPHGDLSGVVEGRADAVDARGVEALARRRLDAGGPREVVGHRVGCAGVGLAGEGADVARGAPGEAQGGVEFLALEVGMAPELFEDTQRRPELCALDARWATRRAASARPG